MNKLVIAIFVACLNFGFIAPSMAAAEKLDVNTAKVEQLSALPGIGEVRAKAIIKGRPYKGKDELVAKKILPQGVYDKIKDGIVAKQK
ncbi:MAG: ComEA family DNA-binding protein [Methylophilaceae bacterium]